MLPSQKTWKEWTLAAFGLVCAPLLLVLGLCLWNMYRDLQGSRMDALRSELQHLRTEAAKRAGRLEALLAMSTDGTGPQEESDWQSLRETSAIKEFWSSLGPRPVERPYTAVIDEAGVVVMHSNPAAIGERLDRGWYERRVPEAGADVVWHSAQPLADGAPAYDVSLPLTVAARWVGEYHEGLDGPWFESVAAARQRAAVARWSWLLALALLADAAAVMGLVYLARQQRGTALRLQRQARARSRELSQLGGGLAHEVRNPLHALRINLHTLRRAMSGRGSLSQEQLVATIQESDAAIGRLDALMRDLLQFTDPAAGQAAELEVSREVQAMVHLLSEDLRRDEIEFSAAYAAEPALVSIDPVRLRQMLLNVLTFAQHRAGKKGAIEIEVSRENGGVAVAVTDSGPPLPADQLTHLFEPFQAPAETGSGLGLALVQTYAEATGGRVALERLLPTGNRLRIWLPLVIPTATGVSL
jgi:signal transduction histidine kinase